MNDGKLCVLHVDDDPAITTIVGGMLRARGIETIPLHDPTQAIQMLLNGGYRVVLLDIDMPGINGLELLDQIKQHDGGISVIMLTGLVSMTSVLCSFRKGASACLFKPVTNIEPLELALQAAFENTERWWETLRELSRRRHESDGEPHASCGEPPVEMAVNAS